MSVRTIDGGLIDMLRGLKQRIERLEGQSVGVRRNDIRLGDIVVTTDPALNRICLENIRTKEMVCLGDPDNIEFSFSGVLTVAGDESDWSPPYVMPSSGTAVNVSVAIAVPSDEDISILVSFNDGSYNTTVTLPATQKTQTVGVNIPSGRGTQTRVKLKDIGAAEGLRDLGVVIQFGSPILDLTISEDLV